MHKKVETEQKETSEQGVQINDKVYKTPNPYTVLDVVYPQFTGVDASFNKKIDDFVQARIAEHVKNAQDNWQARHETDPENIPAVPTANDEKFQFSVKYDISQVNNSTISILIRYGGYEGGAHGYEGIEAFNYNVVAQKEITLQDLFPNDKNYLVTISKFTRNDITNRLKADAITNGATLANWEDYVDVKMINEGTSPNIANFLAFTFTDETIIFHFPEYQVGPYVLGQVDVVMPRQ